LDTPDLERRSRSVREAVFRRSHREHLVPGANASLSRGASE
jgi:hypothetical protein